MRILFLTLAAVMIPSGILTAQTPCCPYIDSIRITPAAPTDQDTVMIVTRSTTPCLGHRIYYAHAMVNDTVYLDGCFYSGMLTVPQNFYDTTWIGPLQPGTWHIHYTGKISIDMSRCEVLQYQTMAATFTVTGTSTAIGGASTGTPAWRLFPNPTDALITLRSSPGNSEPLNWTLYDLNGRRLLSGNTTHQDTNLDLSRLPTGIYLFHGITREETMSMKVVKR